MSTTEQILASARARQAAREAAHVPIDYKAAKREFTQQKAALTRAVRSGDPAKVVLAATKAVREWNQPGRAWPDNWSNWQRALDDALGWGREVDLRDLA